MCTDGGKVPLLGSRQVADTTLKLNLAASSCNIRARPQSLGVALSADLSSGFDSVFGAGCSMGSQGNRRPAGLSPFVAAFCPLPEVDGFSTAFSAGFFADFSADFSRGGRVAVSLTSLTAFGFSTAFAFSAGLSAAGVAAFSTALGFSTAAGASLTGFAAGAAVEDGFASAVCDVAASLAGLSAVGSTVAPAVDDRPSVRGFDSALAGLSAVGSTVDPPVDDRPSVRGFDSAVRFGRFDEA